MTIPIDNLYHWIQGLLPGAANIYYFYPHGSKKLEDVSRWPLADTVEKAQKLRYWPDIICHDQEPLDFEYYQNYNRENYIKHIAGQDPAELDHYKQRDDNCFKNFDLITNFWYQSFYDRHILIHSEVNSHDVLEYENHGYLTVHYWSHGIIARDWFRFAKHDSRLCHAHKQMDYLIYCRDWSFSREYRLKFLEQLLVNKLDSHSKIYFRPTSPTAHTHYQHYTFVNKDFELTQPLAHDHWLSSTVDACASAEYDVDDINSTVISVIMETQFHGSKIHLTEKICRALATGHPFFLLAGPGSLQYLKTYGFKTFDPWLDESYDHEPDSLSRIGLIVTAMRRFSDLPLVQKNTVIEQIYNIAEYNRQHFFSSQFHDRIETELKQGIEQVFDLAKITMGRKFLHFRHLAKKHVKNKDFATLKYQGLADALKFLRTCRVNARLVHNAHPVTGQISSF